MYLQGVRKIAVLRASALGDFIFVLPALFALKARYPQAKISYLGKKWHKDFLQKRKSPIDRVIVIPEVAGVGMPESFSNNQTQLKLFFQEMKKEKFDIAVQLHGGGKYSNPFLLQLGAKICIGTKTKDADYLTWNIPYHYYQSEYMRWIEVLSLIDVNPFLIKPQIFVTEEDYSEAKKKLGNNKKKIIILHPGATDIRRRWPSKNFSLVGDYFAKRGFRIIVTGSGNEKAIIENVISHMHYSADNFYNLLSLNGLTGLLSLSRLVIANDTGPLHLAEAIGCQTIGIYWCGNMINAAPLYRTNTVALSSWVIHCPLCNADCSSSYPFTNQQTFCKHETSFVKGVSTKEVIGQAIDLLA